MDSIAHGVTASCHSGDSDPELERAGRVGQLLARWADSNLRSFPWRGWHDLYRLTVTEILLQQTAASKVAAFVGPWFDRFPSWAALEATTQADLEGVLRPLGLHRRRAAVLRKLAVSIREEPEIALADRPGVGQYVSRAVVVAQSDDPVAMVDVNFVRVLDRVFGGPWMSDYRYDRRLQRLAQGVIDGAQTPRIVNWAVLDLSALLCRPTHPRCAECPIIAECRTGAVVP